MKVNFGKEDNTNGYGYLAESGGYGDMLKSREKTLPDIEKSIQRILGDYNGESICIIVQKEDENGMPDTSEVLLAGVCRPESQVKMAKTLDQASRKSLELLIDASKGDVKMMLHIAEIIAKEALKEKE